MPARRLCVSVFLLFASVAFADAPAPVRFAQSGFHHVLLKCPERLWPGFDFRDVEFVFISPLRHKAWRIGQRFSRPHREELNFEPRAIRHTRSFTIFSKHGRMVVAVNLDSADHAEISQPFAMAVHEYFHERGQAGWNLQVSGRGDLFPLEAQPRYERARLLTALKEYALGDSFSLAEAAGWYAAWKDKFPEEGPLSTDLREGTARFVEQTALALKKVGCEAAPAQVERAREPWIRGLSVSSVNDLDGEGYSIGALAVLLLDREGRPGWQADLSQGKTPLGLLLDDVAPGPVVEDQDLMGKIAAAVAQANEEASRWIDPFVENLRSSEIIRVVVPSSWSERVQNLQGQFIARADSNRRFDLFTPGQEFHGGLANKSWLIATDRLLMLEIAAEETPCGEDGFLLTLPSSAISESPSGRWTAHTESLDFEISASRLESGYLCPLVK